MKTFESYLAESIEDKQSFHLRKAEHHSTMIDISKNQKSESHEAAYKAHMAAHDAHRTAEKSKSKNDRDAARSLTKTAISFSKAAK